MMNGEAGHGVNVVTVLEFGLIGLALAGCQKEPEKYVSKLPQFALQGRDSSGWRGESLVPRLSMRAGQ